MKLHCQGKSREYLEVKQFETSEDLILLETIVGEGVKERGRKSFLGYFVAFHEA